MELELITASDIDISNVTERTQLTSRIKEAVTKLKRTGDRYYIDEIADLIFKLERLNAADRMG